MRKSVHRIRTSRKNSSHPAPLHKEDIWLPKETLAKAKARAAERGETVEQMIQRLVDRDIAVADQEQQSPAAETKPLENFAELLPSLASQFQTLSVKVELPIYTWVAIMDAAEDDANRIPETISDILMDYAGDYLEKKLGADRKETRVYLFHQSAQSKEGRHQ